MRVVVPVPPYTETVAGLVLNAEGIEHELRPVEGEYGYGDLIAELWAEGRGFIIVEHDVAPWCGAVEQLGLCDRDWCMFHYPKHGGSLTRGLGCTKFSDRLVAGHPELSEGWSSTSWRVLDGSVGSAVAEVLKTDHGGNHPLCYHGPPVAHARRSD